MSCIKPGKSENGAKNASLVAKYASAPKPFAKFTLFILFIPFFLLFFLPLPAFPPGFPLAQTLSSRQMYCLSSQLLHYKIFLNNRTIMV